MTFLTYQVCGGKDRVRVFIESSSQDSEVKEKLKREIQVSCFSSLFYDAFLFIFISFLSLSIFCSFKHLFMLRGFSYAHLIFRRNRLLTKPTLSAFKNSLLNLKD